MVADCVGNSFPSSQRYSQAISTANGSQRFSHAPRCVCLDVPRRLVKGQDQWLTTPIYAIYKQVTTVTTHLLTIYTIFLGHPSGINQPRNQLSYSQMMTFGCPSSSSKRIGHFRFHFQPFSVSVSQDPQGPQGQYLVNLFEFGILLEISGHEKTVGN